MHHCDIIITISILKRQAALKATDFVRDGMVVGLGTGTTSKHLILAFGERVRAGLKIQAVPTPRRPPTTNGIPLIESTMPG